MRKLRKRESYALWRAVDIAPFKTKRSPFRCAHRDDGDITGAVESKRCIPPIVYYTKLVTLIISFSYMLFSDAQAQSVGERAVADGLGEIIALKIRDAIPEALWNLPLQVVNHPDGKDTIRLNDYRDKKLIILDFWATWCGACIEAFSKMNLLQEEFLGEVTFLNISTESRQKVADFIKVRGSDMPNLTFIAEGTVLGSYFEHRYLPHYIWIDSDGIIRNTSEPAQVNRTNIREAVTGNFNFRSKIDHAVAYDMDRPLLQNITVQDSAAVSFSSTIMPYQPGFKGLLNIQTDSLKGRKITALNLTRQWLFTTAYATDGQHFSKSNTVLLVKDPEKFTTEARGQDYLDWLAAGNGFCYEQIIRYRDRDSCFNIMQDDMDRMFPEYKAEVITEDIPCLILRVVDEKIFQTTKISDTDVKIRYRSDDNAFYGENIPLDVLIERINNSGKLRYDLVNETGGNARITMQLPRDTENLVEVNRNLERYGIAITLEKRSKAFLIIKDRPTL